MTKLPVCFFVVFSSFIYVANASSPVTLFYNSQQKPKAWTDEDGQAQGFAFDVAVAIFSEANIKYIAKGVPFNRGLELTKKCRGIMTGVFKTSIRQKFLSYSKAIVPDEAVVITRADSAFQYQQISDLQGYRIAYLRGAAFGNEFEQAVVQLNTVTLQDPTTILKVLLKKRIDIAILNPGRATVEYAAKDAGIHMDQLHIAPMPLARIDNYLVTCNQQPAINKPLLQRINLAISALKRKGRFEEIMSRY